MAERAKKFMLFEDNEDGTTKITCNLGDGEPDMEFLIAFEMEDFLGSLPVEVVEQAALITQSSMIYIPSDPGDDVPFG